MCEISYSTPMVKHAISFIFFGLLENAQGKINSRGFESGIETARCGQIVSEANTGSRIVCSERCLAHTFCKGVYYNAEALPSERCKLVTSNTSETINQTLFDRSNYTPYSFKISPTAHCINLGINVTTPRNWRSGCPRLYFPLDAITEGTPGGSDASVIGITSGRINNAFYLPNPTENSQAYFDLGYYPSTSYCFPDPEGCPEGITVAFWLKILAAPTAKQGFITTGQLL